MISKGRRRHVKRMVQNAIWNALTPDQQEAALNRFVEASLDAVSIAYQIPRHMLLGQSK